LLQSLPWLATRAAAAPDRKLADITVTSLEIFRVAVNRRGNWILTRINTSAGITGIGDASHGGPDDLNIQFLHQLFDVFKGRSIFEIEWLRRAAQPYIVRSGAPAAIALSGIEQCLWDIRGKALGVPAADLFGGRLTSRIRNYANINRSTEDRTPAGFARMAVRAIEAGFDAVKLAPFDDMPRKVSDPARIEEFTRLGIDRADLAAIRRAAKMPTAGGEAIYGVNGFYPYIKAEAVDIVMPDVKYCGGMLELKKIGALAEGAGLKVAPHGPASPVGNVAAAHVCATMPNFHILEFSFGEVQWRAELIEPPEQLDKGFLAISGSPGLGITLNEKTIARHPVA
jgi:galactonate dehydratase